MSNTPLPQILKGKVLKPGAYSIEYTIQGGLVYESKDILLRRKEFDELYKCNFTYIVPEPEYLTHGNGD